MHSVKQVQENILQLNYGTVAVCRTIISFLAAHNK